MSLKDLIADVNVNEICEHIETETLSEWVNAWQEAAISALRPISRECGNKAAKKIVQEVLKMIKAEELAKKMRKQRCHHCKDGRSFDGQFIFCGNKGLFSLHFCPGCGAPLTENGEEILVGRLNEALKDGKGD